ncbi:Hypothetical predicted protein [Paramuricea clavata]|uniref:Uncharacterized protein n=1 Tax=Paramuricea clavata TaxID=317549 RepID=A0A7D9E934_PARCT|nr:Hypothetical predicted protein [Paramuricea clavata]
MQTKLSRHPAEESYRESPQRSHNSRHRNCEKEYKLLQFIWKLDKVKKKTPLFLTPRPQHGVPPARADDLASYEGTLELLRQELLQKQKHESPLQGVVRIRHSRISAGCH